MQSRQNMDFHTRFLHAKSLKKIFIYNVAANLAFYILWEDITQNEQERTVWASGSPNKTLIRSPHDFNVFSLDVQVKHVFIAVASNQYASWRFTWQQWAQQMKLTVLHVTLYHWNHSFFDRVTQTWHSVKTDLQHLNVGQVRLSQTNML